MFGWTTAKLEQFTSIAEMSTSDKKKADARARSMMLASAGVFEFEADWKKDLGNFTEPEVVEFAWEDHIDVDPSDEFPVFSNAHIVEWFWHHSLRTDEAFQAAYPFLTKTDRNIRRLRFGEVEQAWREVGELSTLSQVMSRSGCYHYALSLAICVAGLFDSRILEFAQQCGGTAQFMASGKSVSEALKRSSYATSIDRETFSELHMLYGYRNLPADNYDDKSAFDSLTTPSDIQFNLVDFARVREVLMEKVVLAGIPEDKFLPFEEWVEGLTWVTSGSIGSVKIEEEFKWDDGDETGRVRMRKNMVPFVIDVSSAVAEALSDRPEIYRVFVKCEAGKWRLAVAGSFGVYLLQSYLMYVGGSYYLDWPGSTMEENAIETLERMDETISSLFGAFGFPFDFEAFDHQLIKMFMDSVCQIRYDAARERAPVGYRVKLEAIIERVSSKLERAKFVYTSQDGTRLERKHTDKLCSGRRDTSEQGNAYNSFISTEAIRLLTHLIDVVAELKKWIRGDDSLFIEKRWLILSILKTVFDAIGVKSSDSKCSILYENAEFLRVWYTADRAIGYRNRAILSVLTRKPWNEEQISFFDSVQSCAGGLNTCQLRGAPEERVAVLKRTMCQQYCRKANIDFRWASVPQSLGGLGILPDQGWIPSSPLPTKVQLPSAAVTSKWVPNRILSEAKELGYDFSAEMANTMAENRAVELVRTNDDPEYSRFLRRKFNEALKAVRVTWTRVTRCSRVRFKPEEVTLEKMKAQEHPFMYGIARWLGKEIELLNEARRVDRKVSTTADLLKSCYPSVWGEVVHLESLGLRRKDAISWVLGEFKDGSSDVAYHSLFSDYVEKLALGKLFSVFSRLRKKMSSSELGHRYRRIKSAVGHSVRKSSLHLRLGMW